jgi:hypothetical protein
MDLLVGQLNAVERARHQICPLCPAGVSKSVPQCVLINEYCISINHGVTSWMLDAACPVCTLQCGSPPCHNCKCEDLPQCLGSSPVRFYQ